MKNCIYLQMYLPVVLNKMLVGSYFSLTNHTRTFTRHSGIYVSTFVQDIPVISIVDRKAFTVAQMSQITGSIKL